MGIKIPKSKSTYMIVINSNYEMKFSLGKAGQLTGNEQSLSQFIGDDELKDQRLAQTMKPYLNYKMI